MGLHAQSVHRCPYDDGPEPKLRKVYKWVATWRGINTLNARCTCTKPHRMLGTTAPNGMWAGNLQLVAESAAYPKRLGEALFASWVQGSTAISTSWSNAALGLAWVDPRTGAWVSITASPPNGVESGSQGVHDLGPWSMSTRQQNLWSQGVKGRKIWGHGPAQR